MESEATAAVRRALEAEGLARGSTAVLCALSGGADSVALLLALLALRDAGGPAVACVHVEHGLRGASSEADAAFVQALCARRGVPLRLYRAGLDASAPGVEERAREARRAAFRDALVATRADALLTAHHADDQLETLLMRLLRGGGASGLRGIPARSTLGEAYAAEGEQPPDGPQRACAISGMHDGQTPDDRQAKPSADELRNATLNGPQSAPRPSGSQNALPHGSPQGHTTPGLLLRPLLGLSRATLRAEVLAQGETWREDETNREPACLRNRVRLLLQALPEADRAALRDHASDSAALLALDDDCLRAQADALLYSALTDAPPACFVTVAPLLQAPQALRLRALRGWYARALAAVSRPAPPPPPLRVRAWNAAGQPVPAYADEAPQADAHAARTVADSAAPAPSESTVLADEVPARFMASHAAVAPSERAALMGEVPVWFAASDAASTSSEHPVPTGETRAQPTADRATDESDSAAPAPSEYTVPTGETCANLAPSHAAAAPDNSAPAPCTAALSHAPSASAPLPVSAPPSASAPPPAWPAALRRIDPPDERGLSCAQTLALDALLCAPSGAAVNLPCGLMAQRAGGRAHLVWQTDRAPLFAPDGLPPLPLCALTPGVPTRWAGWTFRLDEPAPEAVRAALTTPPSDPARLLTLLLPRGDLPRLTLRLPAPGDRFRALGAPGDKPLHRWLIDRKVDAPLRPFLPVLAETPDAGASASQSSMSNTNALMTDAHAGQGMQPSEGNESTLRADAQPGRGSQPSANNANGSLVDTHAGQATQLSANNATTLPAGTQLDQSLQSGQGAQPSTNRAPVPMAPPAPLSPPAASAPPASSALLAPPAPLQSAPHACAPRIRWLPGLALGESARLPMARDCLRLVAEPPPGWLD